MLEIETGEDIGEPELVTKFAEPTWLPDNASYLYNAFETVGDAVGTQTGALGRPRVMRHTLGSEADELVADLPEVDRVIFDWGVSHDGRWLWLLPRKGTENRNQLWVHPLVTTDGRTEIGERIVLVPEADAEYTVIRSAGEWGGEPRLIVLTDRDAPRGRVVAFDLENVGEIDDADPGGGGRHLRRAGRRRPPVRGAAGGRDTEAEQVRPGRHLPQRRGPSGRRERRP